MVTWQVEVDSRDCEKTGFVTSFGLFQFHVRDAVWIVQQKHLERCVHDLLAGQRKDVDMV